MPQATSEEERLEKILQRAGWGNVKPGHWRKLTPSEAGTFKRKAAANRKEA